MKEDNSNIKLIYEYAEQALKDLDSSSSVLNTKLGAVLGFDVTCLRFSSDLPAKSCIIQMANIDASLICYSCFLLKIFTCLALLCSLFFGWSGFKAKTTGIIILPEELIEKCIDISEDYYRHSIIKILNQSIQEVASARDETAKKLNRSVFFLLIAATLTAIDVILASIIEVSS